MKRVERCFANLVNPSPIKLLFSQKISRKVTIVLSLIISSKHCQQLRLEHVSFLNDTHSCFLENGSRDTCFRSLFHWIHWHLRHYLHNVSNISFLLVKLMAINCWWAESNRLRHDRASGVEVNIILILAYGNKRSKCSCENCKCSAHRAFRRHGIQIFCSSVVCALRD